MLHRVLPAHRERYCLTVWLDGKAEGAGAVNGDEDVQVSNTCAATRHTHV